MSRRSRGIRAVVVGGPPWVAVLRILLALGLLALGGKYAHDAIGYHIVDAGPATVSNFQETSTRHGYDYSMDITLQDGTTQTANIGSSAYGSLSEGATVEAYENSASGNIVSVVYDGQRYKTGLSLTNNIVNIVMFGVLGLVLLVLNGRALLRAWGRRPGRLAADFPT